MGVLLFILLTVLIIAIILLATSWEIHISMNVNSGKPYDWCTFNTFMREFNKYKDDSRLESKNYFKDSIFLYDGFRHVVYLHASIIEFDEKCMILYPLSYIRYCIWKYNFTKHNHKSNRQKGLWKE